MKRHGFFQSPLAVGVYVLSQQYDFFRAVTHQMADFLIQLLGFSWLFPSTSKRNNAKSAKFVTTFNNIYKRTGSRGLWQVTGQLGNGIDFFLIKTSPDKRFAGGPHPVYGLGDSFHLVRAHDEIQIRHAFEQFFSILLAQTPGQAQNQVGISHF